MIKMEILKKISSDLEFIKHKIIEIEQELKNLKDWGLDEELSEEELEEIKKVDDMIIWNQQLQVQQACMLKALSSIFHTLLEDRCMRLL